MSAPLLYIALPSSMLSSFPSSLPPTSSSLLLDTCRLVNRLYSDQPYAMTRTMLDQILFLEAAKKEAYMKYLTAVVFYSIFYSISDYLII